MTRMSSCFFLLPLHFCLFVWILLWLECQVASFSYLCIVCFFEFCYDWNVKLLLSVTIAWFVSLNTELLWLECQVASFCYHCMVCFFEYWTVMTRMSRCSSYFMVCAGFRWFVCSRGCVENYWAGNSQVLCKQLEPLWLRHCHCQYCQHHSGTTKRQGNSVLEGFQTCKHLFSSSLSCSFRPMKSITLYDTDTVKLQQKHFS